MAVSKLVTRSARLLGSRVSLFVDVDTAATAEGCSCDFCEGEETLGAFADAGAGDEGSTEATADDGREEFAADCETSCTEGKKNGVS